ncbi:CaiB/BaiF CoA transferase family protein [Candidatus Poriferisodalis sp.]|uniref:CaiB/BaiF CoA transferase family protein n=1 Tax=Candidatus Poriferisodalis sp. TaxID=3101277 RepID=UPI003AF489EA
MERPLEDVLVLDLTRAVAGPITGRLLADLGARVVKIEPPDGDLTRFIVPHVDGHSAYFAHFNAGKECVSLDLTTAAGRDVLMAMVPKADIVLENYRPGVLDKLGLGYDALAEINPGIIVASVSGWGHGNSRSDRGAFASVLHAEAGVTEMVSRRRGGEPYRNDPMSHADTYSGLHALGAVLAALHMRHRTGRGQTVEVSMAESTLMCNDLAATDLTGQDPQIGFKGGQNWAAVYPLSNGRHVTVTLDLTANFGMKVITAAMDRPDLRVDPRFARIEDRVHHRDELEAIFGEWVSQFDSAEAVEAAIGVKPVMAAEVRTVPELAATDWAQERGAFVDVVAGEAAVPLTVPQSPWRFAGADAGAPPGAVAGDRGQHNREVLAELAGLDAAAIDKLEADGVVSSGPPIRRPAARSRH